MIIRCICIDDEPMARQGIKLALAPFTDFKLMAEYSSSEALLAAFPEDVDVLFVDIQMPRINGFELLTSAFACGSFCYRL